ncbi:MAG: FG-GAP-like repeat-containing protein [Desulfovibrionaceae bacterium]
MRSHMFNTLKLFTLLALACLLLPGAALAQVKTFYVYSFQYMGPDKYQHYGKGASSRIKSKLTLPGKFEPATDASALALGPSAPASASQARTLLSGADVDYLVWGAVNVTDAGVALDVSMQTLNGDPVAKHAEVPLDQVTMELDNMAKQLTMIAFNEAGQNDADQGNDPAAANPAFLNAQTGEQFTATSVNPQFRYEGGAQNTGRWQSQGLRFASRGMAVCDGDGDGKNEIFILGDHVVYAYRYDQGKLAPAGEYPMARMAELISISGLDMDKNGSSELIVTAYRDDEPYSTILSYTGSGFKAKRENIHMFLNVVRTPPTYTPTLIGQPKGHRFLMDSSDVTEVHLAGDSVNRGKKIALPPFGNVYNFIYLPEGGTYKVAMLDNLSRVAIYNSEMQPESVSQETYNSSAIPLELPNTIVPGMETRRDRIEQAYYYVPLPMLVTNLMTASDKHELLLNRDISLAAQVFKRFRTFTQGEIHGMFWDGTGINLAWKTRRIKGTVVDYELADYNNDDKLDLLVLVNTYPGAIQLEYRKTVLFAYDLAL